MVQRCLLIAATLFVAGACEKVKRPSFDDNEESAEVQCGHRVDNLSHRIARPGLHRHVIAIPRRMVSELPTSGKARTFDGPGPELAIVNDRIEFAHQGVADIDDALRQRLDAEAKLYELNREFLPDPNRVPPIYLWTTASTPASTLAKILSVVPALYEPRLLVYGTRDTEVYAPESDAPEQVRAFWREQHALEDPREQDATIQDALTRAIGQCQPLVDLYGNIAALEPSARLVAILNDSPRAIRDCKCEKMDVDLYEAAILATLDAHRPRQRWIPLVFSDDAEVAIVLDKTATVGDLVLGYDSLTNAERARAIGLEFEPAPDPNAPSPDG